MIASGGGKAPDVVVVGAGLVGLAVGVRLAARGLCVRVLEQAGEVASHQSGRNSGVVHTGLYYKPGSARAVRCVEGRALLLGYLEEKGIAHRRLGKLVVATTALEVAWLEALARRGAATGLTGLELLPGEEIHRVEPHARGLRALLVPETAVVSFAEVAEALRGDLAKRGGEVALATPLLRAKRSGGGWRVRTPAGEFSCGRIVNCAGGWAARVAAACGHPPGVVVAPVRGTYREVARPGLVRGLIYPVPDPRFPFLGVHFTKGPDGLLWVGPDAMLALAPHGGRPSLPDLRETLGRRAYWLFLARHLALGAGMVWRASRPGALAAAARRLVPSLRDADLGRRRWGVRAQAIDRAGRLVDDFVLERGRGAVHLLNAPSPGATSCLALAREVEAASVGEP